MVAKWCTVLWFLYWSWGWLVCIENNHAWIRIHSSFLLAFPVRFLIFLFWMIHHFILLSYFSFFEWFTLFCSLSYFSLLSGSPLFFYRSTIVHSAPIPVKEQPRIGPSREKHSSDESYKNPRETEKYSGNVPRTSQAPQRVPTGNFLLICRTDSWLVSV